MPVEASDKALSESIKLTIEGNADADIKEWLEETYPNLQARNILKRIPVYLKEKATEDKTVILGFCMEATKDLYRNLLKVGDFTGALKAVQELAKLSRATKLGVTEKVDAPFNEPEKKDRHELLRLVQNAR
tara:strand:- start:522 stop:914 length:393 start_codon:yes stop_codon:yes gene_type:complete